MTRPHETSDEGYLRLAAAVIQQARRDARRTGETGRDARAFLQNSEALRFWCGVAGAPEADTVVARIRERVA